MGKVSKKKVSKKLSLFGFFALMASMVLSVHEYPTFAVAGMQIPFFLLVVGLLWFLPVALCSAEMATVQGWEDGGIFAWVGKMLGARFGFAAIFFQWLQITICFVTIIYFMLGAVSYLIDIPAINNDPLIKCVCVLVIFWVISFIQLGGIKKTSGFARIGFILGVVVPSLLLVVFGVMYGIEGKPLVFNTEPTTLFPNFLQATTLVVFVSFIFANLGAEASASQINEMANPKRDYPLAILLLVILSTILNAIGGFTVDAVVPLNELSMSSGMVQTFEGLVLSFGGGLTWVVRIICILLILGVLGEIGSWVVGPSRALYTTAERGLLPKSLLGLNKNGVPTRIIIAQGVIVSIWTVVLTLAGGGNNLSFLTAISLTAIIYLVSYLLLFIAYMRLIKHPEQQRGFHVPGGKAGKIIFSVCGLGSSLFALIIAFFPPVVIASDQTLTYEIMLSISFAAALALPFIIYEVYSKKQPQKQIKPARIQAKDVRWFSRISGRGEHLLPPEKDDPSG